MAEPVILDGRLAEIFADSDSESDFYGFSPIQSDDSSDDDEILANVRDRLHKHAAHRSNDSDSESDFVPDATAGTSGEGLTGGAHSADFASESSEFDTSDDEFLADLQPLRNTAKRRRVDTSNVDSDENIWVHIDTSDNPQFHDWCPEFTEQCGIRIDTTDYLPVDFFTLYFDDNLLSLIALETNRYADQIIQQGVKPHARLSRWKPVTLDEIKVYIALQIVMGIRRLPEISDYWSTNWLFSSPCFRGLMTSRRYAELQQVLHFVNNDLRPARDSPDYDPCFKIRPMIKHLQQKFKEVYYPDKEICVDESMCAFKGRVSFRQYLPLKHHRFGIKDWVLCESATGYTYSFYPYTPKSEDRQGERLGSFVVKRLLNNLTGKGHHLYMDRFYSSPSLFTELIDLGTGACGTVNPNAKRMPLEFKSKTLAKSMKKTSNPEFRKQESLLAVAWYDRKPITALSTIHQAQTVRKQVRTKAGLKDKVKPACIVSYNEHMGGVDQNDQKCVYYSYQHKTRKWYHKYYHHLREKSMVNAYILYMKDSMENNTTALDAKAFRIRVAEGLLQAAGVVPTEADDQDPVDILRLNGKPIHWLELVPGGSKPDCVVCSNREAKRRHQTRYRCKACKKPLCAVGCHERFHTLKNYRISHEE